MKDYMKVRNHPDLIRQVESKAILNVDNRSLNKYREERERQMKIAEVVKENSSLKAEIAEIKSMLNKLIEQR